MEIYKLLVSQYAPFKDNFTTLMCFVKYHPWWRSWYNFRFWRLSNLKPIWWKPSQLPKCSSSSAFCFFILPPVVAAASKSQAPAFCNDGFNRSHLPAPHAEPRSQPSHLRCTLLLRPITGPFGTHELSYFAAIVRFDKAIER